VRGKGFVKEVNTIEEKIGRSVIYMEEHHLLRLVARSNLEQNQLDKAEYYSKKAVAVNPHDYQTKFLLGVVYQRAGKSGKAVEMYQETLKLNPDHATTYKNLGIIYLQKIKNYDKALSSFRQSLILAPDQEQAKKIESTVEQLKARVEGTQ